jgi:hypothetical protein
MSEYTCRQVNAAWTLRLLVGCLLLLEASGLSLKAQEPRAGAAQGPHVKILLESVARTLFDGTPFGAGTPVAYWDKGYLLSRSLENFLPNVPNVSLYDKSGKKVRESTVWFPGSQRVVIISAAVTFDGRILASGEADRADGTRARFIASTDSSGNVTEVIQTKDFNPTNICAAPDGTVWSFGTMEWDTARDRPKEGEVFRHFDFQKGQIAGYIQRADFPDHLSLASLSYIRCTSNEVVVYSGPAGLYIEMVYGTEAPRIYRAPIPTGVWLTGFAARGPKDIYGVLRQALGPDGQLIANAAGPIGLYSLVFDETTMTARWVAVEGTVGLRTKPSTITQLWGADNRNLVLSRAEDSWIALHWAPAVEQ